MTRSYTPEAMDNLRAAAARARQARFERSLTGHGCPMCGPFVPIDQSLPYEAKLARANELWGVHARHMRWAKALKARERKRAAKGGA
jgi:hypothetical protein